MAFSFKTTYFSLIFHRQFSERIIKLVLVFMTRAEIVSSDVALFQELLDNNGSHQNLQTLKLSGESKSDSLSNSARATGCIILLGAIKIVIFVFNVII